VIDLESTRSRILL